MAYAFLHMIFAWFLAKIYLFFKKVNFTSQLWFFFFFGAVISDADYLPYFLWGLRTHRTFTHSLLFVLLTFIFIYALFSLISVISKHKLPAKDISLVFSLGILTHIILDLVAVGVGIQLFWPQSYYFHLINGITINKIAPSMLGADLLSLKNYLFLAIMDMGLGTAWILFLTWRKKINF